MKKKISLLVSALLVLSLPALATASLLQYRTGPGKYAEHLTLNTKTHAAHIFERYLFSKYVNGCGANIHGHYQITKNGNLLDFYAPTNLDDPHSTNIAHIYFAKTANGGWVETKPYPNSLRIVLWHGASCADGFGTNSVELLKQHHDPLITFLPGK